MCTTKATDWWWPGLSSTTPSTAVVSPTPRDVVPAVGGSTQGTAATLHASRGTRGQTSGTKPADPGRSTTRAPTTLKTATSTGAEERDTRETTGPPTGRTNTGVTSTTTTTTHGPGNTTTAGVPRTGTRNGTISGPTQTGRTTTVAPTPSRRSTCQPGTPGTSHQWRHRATATPTTRENSIETKETPWGRGLQRQSPRLQTKNHQSSAHPPSCNQKGVPLKTVRSQLQRPEEAGNEDVRTEGGQTTETPPACDQTVENTQTAYQENDTANRNPPQRDTPTADSDAKFHDAEESLEDTKGTESACTGLENTQVTTIAPTCHDAESADAETPECSRPTTEPCTQGTDVTDLTAKQPGEETHVQSGLHGVQAGSGGPAKRLRSSSVVCEGEKRQLTLTETMAKKANKQSAPKPAGTTNTTQSAGATE